MDTPNTFPDPAEVAALLAELKRIPERTLSGKARAALTAAIKAGEIDNIYRPAGAGWWVIALSGLAPTVDMRCRLSEWVAAWQAGRSPLTELLMRESQRNGGQG